MVLIPSKDNPSHKDVTEYVNKAPLDELSSKVTELEEKQNVHQVLHPVEQFFIDEYNRRIKNAGRRRISKKNPTARRRRSSKARKARNSRATRRR